MQNEKSNNKWKQTNNEETFYIYFAEIRKVCQLMTFVNFYLNKLCLGHKIMIYKSGEFFPETDTNREQANSSIHKNLLKTY